MQSKNEYLDYETFYQSIFRNRFFIKYPGRDLKGFLGFLQGFTRDAWYASLLLMLVLPLFLTITWKTLKLFSIHEHGTYFYFWNVFSFLNAFSQKVLSFIMTVSIKEFFIRVQSMNLHSTAQESFFY